MQFMVSKIVEALVDDDHFPDEVMEVYNGESDLDEGSGYFAARNYVQGEVQGILSEMLGMSQNRRYDSLAKQAVNLIISEGLEEVDVDDVADMVMESLGLDA